MPNPSRSTKAKKAHQEFEAFVLQTFVESMLPKDAENTYGKGSAGSIWKSMMAEQIGAQLSRAGGIGIAKHILGSRKAAHPRNRSLRCHLSSTRCYFKKHDMIGADASSKTGSRNMLMKSLDRLEETLDMETSALMARDLSNLDEFNRRKSQCLLEISRIVRTADIHSLDLKSTKRLQDLQVKIEANQDILKRHMHAVQEVASIISNAIQSAESDSTYSALLNQAGLRRMMKNVMAGFWVCAVTLASCYAAVTWTVGRAPAEEKANYEGLQYKKLPPMNIPIVAEGAVQGYVIANLVFTADAKTLREISVPPEAFIQDEIFRYVYADETLDFKKLSRYNVNGMIGNVARGSTSGWAPRS